MIPYDIPLPIVLAWLFIFGSVVGSFLNVCIYRIPLHERLWDQLSGLNHPPSTCPFCKKRILAIDNVPILGWMWLRGRCRFCRHSIPIRYALIEFFNGLIWVVLYLAIVPAGYYAKADSSVLYSTLGSLGQPGLDRATLIWLLNAEYFYFLAFAEALLVATFIDFDTMTIPDGVTVPGMIVGVLGGLILGAPTLWPTWFFARQELNGLQSVLPNYLHWMLSLPEQISWFSAHPHWHGLINSLLGLLVGGGTVAIIRLLGNRALGRESMGDGDIIFMAMIGSYIGWQPSLIVFFMLAPIFALCATTLTLTLRFDRHIPFGPYLSGGAIAVVLFWKPFFSTFETFFSRGPLLLMVFVLMGAVFFPLLLLIRACKRMLGFEDNWEDDEYVEVWTSGDQLKFYANKEERQIRNPLQSNDWPGVSAGQGTSHADRWRGSK